jgi:hypothetical protein
LDWTRVVCAFFSSNNVVVPTDIIYAAIHHPVDGTTARSTVVVMVYATAWPALLASAWVVDNWLHHVRMSATIIPRSRGEAA